MDNLLGKSPDSDINDSPVDNSTLNDRAGTQDLSPDQLNTLFHLAAQATLHGHMASQGVGLQRVQVQGAPNFFQRFGSAMLGHPIDPNANSVVGTPNVPDQSALPPGMQLKPIGTDANGRPLYDYSQLENQQKTLGGVMAYQGKQALTKPALSTDMASAIATGDQGKVNTQWQLEHPEGTPMPSQLVQLTNAAKGTGLRGQIGDALATRAGVQKLLAMYKISGGDGMNQMASRANVTLGAISRAKPIVDQIEEQGGSATPPQRAELARALAAITTSGQGIVTNDAMDQFLPSSLKAKGGHFLEYLTNAQQPVDFSGFLPQFKGMLDRETEANQGISNGAAAFGLGLAQQMDPRMAQTLESLRRTNPIVGNPSNPGQVPGLPPKADLPASQPKPGQRKSLADIFGSR